MTLSGRQHNIQSIHIKSHTTTSRTLSGRQHNIQSIHIKSHYDNNSRTLSGRQHNIQSTSRTLSGRQHNIQSTHQVSLRQPAGLCQVGNITYSPSTSSLTTTTTTTTSNCQVGNIQSIHSLTQDSVQVGNTSPSHQVSLRQPAGLCQVGNITYSPSTSSLTTTTSRTLSGRQHNCPYTSSLTTTTNRTLSGRQHNIQSIHIKSHYDNQQDSVR